MDKIGIAISGRDPGFQVFTTINWKGPEPYDGDIREVSVDSRYVSVELRSDYDTYEMVLCNFKSSSGRKEVFRIALRVPHSYTIIDKANDNATVLPLRVLNEVLDIILVSGTLQKEPIGPDYIFPQHLGDPEMPVMQIMNILDQYSIKASWNPFIVMGAQSGNPYYIETDTIYMGVNINALTHCESLRGASTVYFGHFYESQQPKYIFSEAETQWQPKVYATVYRKNEPAVEYELGEMATQFNSANFGYDVRAYENVEVSLKDYEVLKAYRSGLPLPYVNGASLTLNQPQSAVDIRFNPQPLRKSFKVVLRRADNKEVPAIALTEIQTTLESATWIPVCAAGYEKVGEDIITFERQIADTGWLRSKFNVAKPNFEIVDVKAIGSNIEVYVKYVAPKNQPKKSAADAPTSGATLAISYPKRLGGSQEYVYLQRNEGDRVLEMLQKVQCVDNNGNYEGVINLPAEMGVDANFSAFLGENLRVSGQVKTEDAGKYCVTFDSRNKAGLFSLYAELFRPAYSYTIGVGEKIIRAGSYLLLIIVLVLLGFLAGFLVSDVLVQKDIHPLGLLEAPVSVSSSDQGEALEEVSPEESAASDNEGTDNPENEDEDTDKEDKAND